MLWRGFFFPWPLLYCTYHFFYMSAVNFLLTCYFVCYTCYFVQKVIFLWPVILSVTAVIFVVDSSNRDRLAESCNELAKLVQEKELKEASLLIFANKQVLHHFYGIIDKAKFLRYQNWFWIAFPSKYRSKNKIWSLNNMLSSLMFWNWCNTWYLWRWPLSFGSNTKNKDTLASR